MKLLKQLKILGIQHNNDSKLIDAINDFKSETLFRLLTDNDTEDEINHKPCITYQIKFNNT